MSGDVTAHWDRVYSSKRPDQVSWYQGRPDTSLRLLVEAVHPAAAVIDVGAGASTLADELLDRGFTDVTVLDVSAAALECTQTRLAGRQPTAAVIIADLLAWQPERQYDAWHDRAVFHFLVEPSDRHRYVSTALRTVRSGGHLVLGAFAEDGPTQCSGLPTARYDTEELAAQFSAGFELVHAERDEHQTPGGVTQSFTWVVLTRKSDLALDSTTQP